MGFQSGDQTYGPVCYDTIPPVTKASLSICAAVWGMRPRGKRMLPPLKSVGAKYQRLERATLIDEVAQLIADEKVIGWFNGRMEFGPRALGNRSIIGDPRSAICRR